MSASSSSIPTNPFSYAASSSSEPCSSSSSTPLKAIPTLGQLLYHLFIAGIPSRLGYSHHDQAVLRTVQVTYPRTILKLAEVVANALGTAPGAQQRVPPSKDNIGDLEEYLLLYGIHHFMNEFPLIEWELFYDTFCEEQFSNDHEHILDGSIIEQLGCFLGIEEMNRLVYIYSITHPDVDKNDPKFELKADLEAQKAQLKIFKNATDLRSAELESEIRKHQAVLEIQYKNLIGYRKQKLNQESWMAEYIKALEVKISNLPDDLI